MDDADIASEQEEAARAEALRTARTRPVLQANGRCYNCGEDCWGLFCDEGCTRDYDKRTRLQARMRIRDDYDPQADREAFDASPIREAARSTPTNGELDAQAPRRGY